MQLPEAYITQKFYQYAGKPKYNKLTKTYQGCCPICREGKSWGKKRRLFYIIKENYFHCHNCGWNSSPIEWIHEVSGYSYKEILNESNDYDLIPDDLNVESQIHIKTLRQQVLPTDSINLFDQNQLNYFKNDKIINLSLNYLKTRRLETAINRPNRFYVSLNDKIHKNRLIIPFYDKNNKIIHYQTRTLLKTDEKYKPKYLSKVNSDKSVFNINNIDETYEKIYIFEGPIDACFVKNGVAVAGINENSKSLYNKLQKNQLNMFPMHEQVIVLDSQWKDGASLKKTKILLENGYKVFIWPKILGTTFKDFNEIVVKTKRNEIPLKLINENTYHGLVGLINLSQIKQLHVS